MKLLLAAVSTCLLLSACASRHADRFYVLTVQPPGPAGAASAPITQAVLRVTLPSVVDRPEMVLNTSADGVIVQEHERWAAPLADLVTQTLARDLERRRSGLLVAGAGVTRPGGSVIKVNVDVVQMTLRKGQQASIEAHWRILEPSGAQEEVGGEVFNAALTTDDYAAVAQAVSQCLGLLADRLIERMH